ncbi:hypothetical protein BDQ17DRAFT_1422498 [Cyathus striatus]|nr:hypothetical protein BDQ17DRAFT_1422498 [Cyathus striatus]
MTTPSQSLTPMLTVAVQYFQHQHHISSGSLVASTIWSFSSFGYKLTEDDIRAVPSHSEPGVIAGYIVNDRLSKLLWTTLNIMARTILDSALPLPPLTLFPLYMFDTIGLHRPDVLDVLTIHLDNPLSFVCGTRDEAIKRYRDLQLLLLETAVWMADAQDRCASAAHAHGWQWQIQANSHPQIAAAESPMDLLNDSFSDLQLSPFTSCTDVILHPTASTYARLHPGYNAWGAEVLENNVSTFHWNDYFVGYGDDEDDDEDI